MAWDFWTKNPASLHQITILFSDRGTPDGFRHMDGFGSHSFKWVNAHGEVFFVKYHFKTDQGIKNFIAAEAQALSATDKDYATKDLFENIEKGNFPSWTLKMQIMPERDADKYRYDVLDITKTWSQHDYPLIPVGKMVLNRNQENFHAEVEQVAFSPGNLVPGIEPSNDKMLMGRIFSYPDTHRHRLGGNFEMIPVNCPYKARVSHNHRDGPMQVQNQGSGLNYEPNSSGMGPYEAPEYKASPYPVSGNVGRYAHSHPNDDYEQARILYAKVMTETDREHLTENIAGALGPCRRDI
jgi:catalase